MSKYFEFKPEVEKFVPGESRIAYGGAMIGQEEIDAILDVVTSQGGRRWTVGPESLAFEKELAEYAQVKRAVVTNSGSSGLLIALASLKLGYQRGVVIPATNFPTAFNSIIQNSLRPVVVDTDPYTFLLRRKSVEKKLAESGNEIKAILAVNIAGNTVDVDWLLSLKEKYGVYLILDNCDGFGTLWKGKPVDSYFDVSIVSFHAAHIITTGEGGAVLTNSDTIADTAIKFREWGRASGTDDPYDYPGLPKAYRSRYVYEEIGYNLKPLELQCAMGRVQLKKIDQFRQKRMENYQKLLSIFENYPVAFDIPRSLPEAEVCWFGFPIWCRFEGDRDKLMDFFEKKNIETRNVFSGNILRHPAYKNIWVDAQAHEFKGADEVMRNGMFISCHPSLTNEKIEYIEQCLAEFRKK